MRAYYNENEPFAVEWLCNLIAAGQIAPGDVDDRSIVEVAASDLVGYDQCHFFAGIGVWSHALRTAGWSDDRPVWTGSCPCQPFSQAGKRACTADARHLWPAWFRLIRERCPPVCFGEQVSGGDGLAWWDAVSADLEGAGYAVGALDTCAAGVGAPHIRQRLYFVAESDGERRHREHALLRAEARGRNAAEIHQVAGGSESVLLADAQRYERGQVGAHTGRRGKRGGAEGLEQRSDNGGAGFVADAACRGTAAIQQSRWIRSIEPGGSYDILANPERGGSEAGRSSETDRRSEIELDRHGATNLVGRAIGARSSQRQERQERRGPLRHEGPAAGAPSAVRRFWRDAEWIPCADGKLRAIESGVRPLAVGTPGRVGRLRAYGNSLVAPLAAEFVMAYTETAQDAAAYS